MARDSFRPASRSLRRILSSPRLEAGSGQLRAFSIRSARARASSVLNDILKGQKIKFAATK